MNRGFVTARRTYFRRIAFAIFVVVLVCSVARVDRAQIHAASASATEGSQKSASPSSAAQTANPPAPKLNDLSWLEGRWRGEWGPRVAEQIWMAPKAGVMAGMFSVIETDKTLVIELFSLEQKTASIDFYLRHFTPELAPWESDKPTMLRLTSADGKKFVFENPADGKPKRTVFTRLDADTYIWRSEIVPENEEPQIVEITYRCMQHATDAAAGSAAHKKKS